jgi:shikimate dehydrogenase
VTAAPSRLVLLGHPVSHSLSPRMQNAALRAARLAVRYEALDVPPQGVANAVAQLAAEGAAGNVTIPHKAAVAAVCARLEPLAQRTGAVNTFWTEDGALVGDNTDVDGFDDAVRELLGALPSGIVVGLLGAGGAAAGVLAAIERWGGCSVILYNRSMQRARELSARFPSIVRAADEATQALASAALVVNATSVGLADDTMPVALEQLPAGVPVLDLVYRAGETAFVRMARQRGHRALGGLPMLVGQGAAAFERWFGFAPDRSVMWEAVQGAG